MEYLIENVYIDSEKLLRQVYEKILRKRQVLWTVTMAVMSVLFLFGGVVLKDALYQVGAAGYMALAVWFWLLPRRMARKAHKKMLKFYDGVIPETVVRFGETITLTQADRFTTIPYNKLKRVSVLKDCLLLHDEIGGVYFLSNDGFTKGGKQDMLALLKEKCPNVKLPDWQW